ncbi:MAG: hypothetical protein AVDCRST_MAG52-2051 [uncultured Blastococcus sp.]|uniref:Uncharacterized protein n=1 Tax=uncultured Blastococcus sp. TaxID=217144 RepID=A0A6J4IHZ8_9ACTN|nr:MAG: hypothetical protein AVDCRST_MAG52-2051 [uncultured Blastococcus sp.]
MTSRGTRRRLRDNPAWSPAVHVLAPLAALGVVGGSNAFGAAAWLFPPLAGALAVALSLARRAPASHGLALGLATAVAAVVLVLPCLAIVLTLSLLLEGL